MTLELALLLRESMARGRPSFAFEDVLLAFSGFAENDGWRRLENPRALISNRGFLAKSDRVAPCLRAADRGPNVNDYIIIHQLQSLSHCLF
jgi:hypothetical protein